MKTYRCTNGSATILALLLSAVMVTISVGFNWLVKEHLKAAEGLRAKTEAALHATSTYETLIYCLVSGTVTNREVVLYKGEEFLGLKTIPLNGQRVKTNKGIGLSVQDSNGMFSITHPEPAVLRRLIGIVAPENKNANVIANSLMDWIDTDSFNRLDGAEDSFYRFEGRPYTARNYPIQYIEELSLIRGMDGDLFRKLLPHITLLPNTGFNPNTATDEVLMAYLDIDKGAVQALREYMKDRPIRSNGELFGLVGRNLISSEAVYFVPSSFWDIKVYAGQPRDMYSIQVGVLLRAWLHIPYSIIYWKEG
jgi:general secretion pathway protein K